MPYFHTRRCFEGYDVQNMLKRYSIIRNYVKELYWKLYNMKLCLWLLLLWIELFVLILVVKLIIEGLINKKNHQYSPVSCEWFLEVNPKSSQTREHGIWS